MNCARFRLSSEVSAVSGSQIIARVHFATDIAAGETDVGADSDEEVRPPVLVSIDSAVMLLLV